jgi:thymidine phosphorylase
MRAIDIIIKKRDPGELTRDEIEFFIQVSLRGKFRITKRLLGQWQFYSTV